MKANEANYAWSLLLSEILLNGSNVTSRGMSCRELLNKTSIIDMSYPVLTIKNRKLGYRYMAAEAAWILSGSNRVSELVPFSKLISEFSDDRLRLQGAYGPMVAEQMRYVVDTLFSDPGTRQAVMTTWRPNPRQSKDVPCTVSLQFLIRDHALHCIVTMRSSDAWLGWPYDVFTFSMISATVLLELRARNPSIWSSLDLGVLRLNAGSQHLYERDLEKAYQMISTEHLIIGEYNAIDIHTFNTPDHLIDHLCCVRDHAWGALTSPFLSELEQFNEPTRITSKVGTSPPIHNEELGRH